MMLLDNKHIMIKNYKVGDQVIVSGLPTKNRNVSVLLDDDIENNQKYYLLEDSADSDWPDVSNTKGGSCVGWIDSKYLIHNKNYKSEIKKTIMPKYILDNEDGLEAFSSKEGLYEYLDGEDTENYKVYEVSIIKSFTIDSTPRLVEVNPVKKTKLVKSKKK